jgi:hypothetical protein
MLCTRLNISRMVPGSPGIHKDSSVLLKTLTTAQMLSQALRED